MKFVVRIHMARYPLKVDFDRRLLLLNSSMYSSNKWYINRVSQQPKEVLVMILSKYIVNDVADA